MSLEMVNCIKSMMKWQCGVNKKTLLFSCEEDLLMAEKEIPSLRSDFNVGIDKMVESNSLIIMKSFEPSKVIDFVEIKNDW